MITNKQKAHMKRLLQEFKDKWNTDNSCKGINCNDCLLQSKNGEPYCKVLDSLDKMIEKLNIKTCKHCGKPLED